MRASATRAASLALLLGMGSLLGCKAPPSPVATSARETITADPEDGRILLGPNDRIVVSVANRPELSTPGNGLAVDLEGNLHLPIAGPVAVEGRSLSELRTEVTERLRTFVKRPLVSVSVAEYASRRIYVIGHVDEAGAHVLDRPLNAIQALAMAGPFKAGADRGKVALLRRHEDGIEVHFFDAETPDAKAFVSLRPDDLLVVRRSGAGRFNEVILPFINGTLGSTGGWANTTSALRTMDDL